MFVTSVLQQIISAILFSIKHWEMYWSGAVSACNSSGFGDDSAFQENFHKASYFLVEHKIKELVTIWQRAV